MDARPTYPASARQLLCLAASILGLMILAFGMAPGTVLASPTKDVYTEEEAPPTPKEKEKEGDDPGDKNRGQDPAESGNGNGSGADAPGDDSGNSSKPGSKRYSNGKYNPATDSDKNGSGKGADDDETVAVASTSGGDDGGGGSALPWVIAILVGVPLIGGGGYYLWQRFRGGDDETRDRLKSALGGSAGSEETSKPA